MKFLLKICSIYFLTIFIFLDIFSMFIIIDLLYLSVVSITQKSVISEFVSIHWLFFPICESYFLVIFHVASKVLLDSDHCDVYIVDL